MATGGDEVHGDKVEGNKVEVGSIAGTSGPVNIAGRDILQTINIEQCVQLFHPEIFLISRTDTV